MGVGACWARKAWMRSVAYWEAWVRISRPFDLGGGGWD